VKNQGIPWKNIFSRLQFALRSLVGSSSYRARENCRKYESNNLAMEVAHQELQQQQPQNNKS